MYSDSGKIIGFCGVLHQPYKGSAKVKRCSRLVVLPDYQGIGLGRKFLNVVGDYYINRGYKFNIVTSAKNMIVSLQHDDSWKLRSYCRHSCSSGKSKFDSNRKSIRSNCKVASFTKITTSDGDYQLVE